MSSTIGSQEEIHELANGEGLSTLPNDLILNILYLARADIRKIACVSQTFALLSREPMFRQLIWAPRCRFFYPVARSWTLTQAVRYHFHVLLWD